MKIRLTEEIWKEGNMLVSYCPELDIASCGQSVEQAKNNLREVILINIEETKTNGIFDQFLQNAGFEEVSFARQSGSKLPGYFLSSLWDYKCFYISYLSPIGTTENSAGIYSRACSTCYRS